MRRLLRVVLKLFQWSAAAAVFLGGAVLVAAIATWWTVQVHFEESEAVVPALVGLSVERAEERLDAADLALRVEARRPHETVEEGHVFFQEPHADARTRRKRQVRVIVSTGPSRQEVPQLVNGSARAALLQLGRDGLTVGQVHRVHAEDVVAGQVIAQEPTPGSRVAEGEPVDLLVSSGSRRVGWVMPDLAGRSLPEVETTLASAGLRLSEVRQLNLPGVPGGRVHSQTPAAGSRVTSETAIAVVVSREIEVPTADAFPSFQRFDAPSRDSRRPRRQFQ